MSKRWLAVGMGAVAVILVCMPSAAVAQHATVTGIACGTYEIVADSGDVYELVADEKGSEIAGLDGMRVKANGVLEVAGGRMILQVLSYAVLEEEPWYPEDAMEEPLPGAEPPVEEAYPPEEEPYLEEEPMAGQEYLEGEIPEDGLPE